MRRGELLGKAIAMAARAHDGQKRKDNVTPYISHPLRVCMTLVSVFGVEDEEMLTAAVLHDIIEDTTKDFDDIEEMFGLKVASWVANLSKDKRVQERTREECYFDALKNAPAEVKLIKLADVYDNLTDSVTAGEETIKKIVKKTDKYLKEFAGSENKDVIGAMKLVSELLKEKEA